MPLTNILSSDDSRFTTSLGHWALVQRVGYPPDPDSGIWRTPPDGDWWGWTRPTPHAGTASLEEMGGYADVGLVGSHYPIPDRHIVRFSAWFYADAYYLWDAPLWLTIRVGNTGASTPIQGGNSSNFNILTTYASDTTFINYWSYWIDNGFLAYPGNVWHQFVGFCAIEPYLTALNGTNDFSCIVSGMGGGTYISHAWMSDVSVVHQAIPPVTGFTATAFHPRRIDLAWDGWDDMDLEINQGVGASTTFPGYALQVKPAITDIVVERSGDGGATWVQAGLYRRWGYSEARGSDVGWWYSDTNFGGPQANHTYWYRAFRGWSSSTAEGGYYGPREYVARSGYTAIVSATTPPLMADPADEPGWRLATVHDWAPQHFRGDSIGVAQNEHFIYLDRSPSRINLVTFAVDDGFSGANIATGPNGYVSATRNYPAPPKIVRMAPNGTITDWFSFGPTPLLSVDRKMFCIGRDGRAYAAGGAAIGVGPHYATVVIRVNTNGTWEEITDLRIDSADPFSYDFGYAGITATSDGTVWLIADGPDPGGVNYNINTTLIRWKEGQGRSEVPIQALVSPGDDGNTEAYGGIFADYQDHLIVPMVTYQAVRLPVPGYFYTPELSWFLRVAPDGTTTRIAGTWVYPQTNTNIANGPLGVSLACEVDNGAGMSADGRTLYFVDDGAQEQRVYNNLIRILTNKPPGGWAVGVRIR